MPRPIRRSHLAAPIAALALGLLVAATLPAWAASASESQSPGSSQGAPRSGQPPVVVLRSHIVVKSGRVTLGDMFSGAGKAGDQVFAAAPAPGQSAYFLSGDVYAATEAAGLIWRPNAALHAIKVTRQGRDVPASAIRKALRAALGAAAKGPVELQIANPSLRLVVATEAAPTARVTNLNFDSQSGHFSATLVAPATGPEAGRQNLQIYGRLVHLLRIPTLREQVATGQVITAGDLRWMTLPSAQVSPNVVTSAATLVGMAARDSLAPGRPILVSDVQRPVLVRQGALVNMTLVMPNMVLTAIGKALTPGGLSDVIEVQNTQSLKIVAARVTGPNEVRLWPNAAPMALQAASLD